MHRLFFSHSKAAVFPDDSELAFCLTLSKGSFWLGKGDVCRTMREFCKLHDLLKPFRKRLSKDKKRLALADLVGGYDTGQFMKAGYLNWCNYTLGRTKSGLSVIGIGSIQQNDEVALMKGYDTPLIVRANTSVSGQFKLVGSAYVHGIMDGQWWDERKCRRMDFV